MANQSDYTKGILAASLAALLWGFLPIVLKVALSVLSPIDVSWFRFAIAFIFQLAFVLITQPSGAKILLKPPPLLILAAVFLGFNYLGLISGIHYSTPAIAEVFIQSGAIFLAIVGFLFYKEKATTRQVLGLIIVVSGLAIFYRDQIIVLAENADRYQKGVFLTLFGGIMWTSYAILQKGLVKKFHPMQLNLVLFGIPAIGYLPWVNFEAVGTISLGMWGVVLFLGLNTLLAYGGIAYALKYIDASKVSVIVTLNPIITFVSIALLMYIEVSWVMHENLTLVSVLGAGMVVGGAVMTILKAKSGKLK